MRTRRGFMAALVVLFVLVSVLTSEHATQRTMTGTVVGYDAGRSIVVTNDQTGPAGLRLVLRDTAYEGDTADIRPGIRVTVWYRSLAESRLVADRVRVLADGSTR